MSRTTKLAGLACKTPLFRCNIPRSFSINGLSVSNSSSGNISTSFVIRRPNLKHRMYNEWDRLGRYHDDTLLWTIYLKRSTTNHTPRNKLKAPVQFKTALIMNRKGCSIITIAVDVFVIRDSLIVSVCPKPLPSRRIAQVIRDWWLVQACLPSPLSWRTVLQGVDDAKVSA